MPRHRGMGGRREKFGKEGRGQAVTHGIKRKFIFGLFKTRHAHGLRGQVFEYVVCARTCVHQVVSVISDSLRPYRP